MSGRPCFRLVADNDNGRCCWNFDKAENQKLLIVTTYEVMTEHEAGVLITNVEGPWFKNGRHTRLLYQNVDQLNAVFNTILRCYPHPMCCDLPVKQP